MDHTGARREPFPQSGGVQPARGVRSQHFLRTPSLVPYTLYQWAAEKSAAHCPLIPALHGWEIIVRLPQAAIQIRQLVLQVAEGALVAGVAEADALRVGCHCPREAG